MDALRDFYSAGGPERMGLVLRDGTIIECQNVAADPMRTFLFRAEDLMEHEVAAVATWHTHPDQSCNLSLEDYDGFMNWPEWSHYIVGNDGVRRYYVEDGRMLQE